MQPAAVFQTSQGTVSYPVAVPLAARVSVPVSFLEDVMGWWGVEASAVREVACASMPLIRERAVFRLLKGYLFDNTGVLF